MTDNKHAEAVEAVALLLYNRALLALGLPARDSFYGLDDPDGYREDARTVIKALAALNTRPDVEAMRRVALALVTVERAEHGLPPCEFSMLTYGDQLRYMDRAKAAIRSIPVPTSGEGA